MKTNGTENLPTFLTPEETAEMLGLKASTVKAWAQRGTKLARYKIGRAVKFALADVHAFIAASRREPIALANGVNQITLGNGSRARRQLATKHKMKV